MSDPAWLSTAPRPGGSQDLSSDSCHASAAFIDTITPTRSSNGSDNRNTSDTSDRTSHDRTSNGRNSERNTVDSNGRHRSNSRNSSNSSSGPTFKVILVGEVGVGKTSLFYRIRYPQHAQHEISASFSSSATIGVDTCTRTFATRYGNVTLTVWDTAGVERYRTLTRNYYRNTNAALLVYSLDDANTLFSLSRWQRDVIESAPSAHHFLLGNKSDLVREVIDEAVHAFADSHNCQAAFLTSAKNGEGVEEALVSLCEHLVSKYRHKTEMRDRDKLWHEGSGLHVHGRGEKETSNSKLCC